MAEHNDLGKKGEELARKFLSNKGFKIVDTNWTFGKDEIDIVAYDKEYLVIVEVKTRRSNYFGEPYFAVTKKKQEFLIRAAQAYITRKDVDNEARFDIISIVVTPGGNNIEHIEDAFYPTL